MGLTCRQICCTETAGIKINDPHAKDPVSKIPIGYEDLHKIQSCELCWPFKIIIAKDTKALYANHFSDFFDFFKQVEERGFDTYTQGFLISSPRICLCCGKLQGRVAPASKRSIFVAAAPASLMMCTCQIRSAVTNAF
jgi:hypothetical protein